MFDCKTTTDGRKWRTCTCVLTSSFHNRLSQKHFSGKRLRESKECARDCAKTDSADNSGRLLQNLPSALRIPFLASSKSLLFPTADSSHVSGPEAAARSHQVPPVSARVVPCSGAYESLWRRMKILRPGFRSQNLRSNLLVFLSVNDTRRKARVL